ncbi:MAG: flagellar assembly peptidoglycan hydrolase FlgJ [Burkholderiaceae bacterium]
MASVSQASSASSAATLSLQSLRASAARDPKAAIKEAAKQFEAIFMQQLMKSMRDATLSSGMLDNAGTQLGTELLDKQFAQQMTGLPGGLGAAIARQLERQMGGPAETPAAAVAPAGAAGSAEIAPVKTSQRQTDFLRRHDAAAREAEQHSGIPAAFMLAQAAHESGWGQREIRQGDGTTAHNLFGIKAGAGWKGATTEVATTEVVNGEPRKVMAKFRAYASYEASFRDYARLMKESPRYAQVVAAAATSSEGSAQRFAQGLQKAGYATDPAYADKLGRVINTTLRLQRTFA